MCRPCHFSREPPLLHILFSFQFALAHCQFENSLRRHNHVGLVHALLLGLAKLGKLDAAADGAKEKMKERRQKIKEGKMDEGL